MSLDRFCVDVADERRRGPSTITKLATSERLLELPYGPFPAEVCVERSVSRSALVAFEGNHYSAPAAFAGAHRSPFVPASVSRHCGSSAPRAR